MATDTTLVFLPFALDLASERLLRGSRPIPLRPKTFAVLRYLAEHPGRLVTPDELLAAIWPDVHVGRGLPKDSVLEIRRALGDRPRTPRFIETAHGRGYRFVARVSRGGEVAAWDTADTIPGIVGRQAEMGRLSAALDRVQRGARRLLFIGGEAGIGKTTLLEAFRQRLAGSALWYGHGQCIEQFGAGEAYLPVLEALGRLCREPDGSSLAAALRTRAPSWLAQMPGVFADAAPAAAGSTHERMLRELADAVEAMTVERPLVLVLEDLHWSDHSTLELLSALARRPERARLLIVGTYRPPGSLADDHPLRAVVQELRLHRQCQEIRLPFLDEPEVSEYVAWRFGRPEASWTRAVARAIHRSTEGNPLFMVHVVDDLVERGVLTRDDGRWPVTAANGLTIEAPADVRQMIERQLDALPQDDQRVLEAASVAGTEFSAAAVAAALTRPLDAVEVRCAALARREHFLVSSGVAGWPDGTTAARLRFVHTLHRDVVYERIPPGTRGELHRRVGAREEQAYGAGASERASELAVHFELGGDARRALEYRKHAAENALQRHAYRDAAEQFARAITALRALPDTEDRAREEFELQLSLAMPMLAMHGEAAPEVERPLARAHELGQRLGDPLRFPLAVLGQWGLRFARGDLRTAREIATHLLDLAGRTRSRGPLLGAHLALGLTATYEGKLSAAEEHLARVVALLAAGGRRDFRSLFDRVGLVEPQVACAAYRALISCARGLLDRGRDTIEDGRRIARATGNAYALVTAEGFAAMVHQSRQEPATAEERATATIALAQEHGFPQWAGLGAVLRGWARVARGAGAEGIEEIRDGLATWRSTGAEVGHPTLLALLADACGRVGRPRQGLAAIEEGLAAVERSGERFIEAELHRLRGELLGLSPAGDGRAQAGTREREAAFRKAIDIAHRCGATLFELRAAVSLCRLHTGSRRVTARRHLEQVYGGFSEGFDTDDLRRARELLDEQRQTTRRS